MAKEFYTVKVIPHLENETGEYDYVPTFEVRIDKGGEEKSSTARLICPEWPSVFRSNKQIYAQVINDLTGTTLASASSLGLEKMPKKEQAAKVGELVAANAIAAGVSAVVFDRNGYLYHGRVKELADAARNGGLKF